MAYPDWNLLAELDTLNAASLNTPLAAIEDAINDIETDSVAPRGLRQEHLPSLIPAPGAFGVSVAGSTAGDYDNLYPGYNTSTMSGAGVGPGLGGTGWAVINDGSSGLQVNLGASYTLNMSGADRIAGLLILANIEVVRITASTATATNGGAFGIMWRNGAGTRTILPHTERFKASVVGDSVNRYLCRDISIRTILHGGLLPAPGTTVAGIDVVAAFRKLDGGAVVNQIVRIRRGNLTVIPLHAADVV